MSVVIDGERRCFGGPVVVFEREREVTFESNWYGPHAWPVPTFFTLRLTPLYDGTMVEIFHCRWRVSVRFGNGSNKNRAPLSQLFRFVPMLVMARLRGDHTRSPSFDAKTGELRVEPRVLTDDELLEVERSRDAS